MRVCPSAAPPPSTLTSSPALRPPPSAPSRSLHPDPRLPRRDLAHVSGHPRLCADRQGRRQLGAGELSSPPFAPPALADLPTASPTALDTSADPNPRSLLLAGRLRAALADGGPSAGVDPAAAARPPCSCRPAAAPRRCRRRRRGRVVPGLRSGTAAAACRAVVGDRLGPEQAHLGRCVSPAFVVDRSVPVLES